MKSAVSTLFPKDTRFFHVWRKSPNQKFIFLAIGADIFVYPSADQHQEFQVFLAWD